MPAAASDAPLTPTDGSNSVMQREPNSHHTGLDEIGIDEAKHSFVRIHAPSWCPRWMAWATVTLCCSLFYIAAMATVFALALTLCSPYYRYHGLGLLAVLGLLSVYPNKQWPALHSVLGALWFDIFEMRANVPRLQPGERYLFVIAPHGVFPFWSWSFSAYLHQLHPSLGNVGGGVASVLLRVPLMRQLCKWTGCMPASFGTLKRALTQRSQQLCPEGIAGIFDSEGNFCSDYQVLRLSNRKGFVKLACLTGAHIVPVYCFGTSDTFRLLRLPSALAILSRKLRVSLTIFCGRFGLPMPYPVRLTMSHGEVVRVPQTHEPTDELINQIHAQVIHSLQQAFEAGKRPAGYPSQRLDVR